MGKLNIRLIAVVLTVVVALCLVFLAAYLFAPDAARAKDVFWGMQAGVAALAVILGESFAAHKWEIYRES